MFGSSGETSKKVHDAHNLLQGRKTLISVLENMWTINGSAPEFATRMAWDYGHPLTRLFPIGATRKIRVTGNTIICAFQRIILIPARYHFNDHISIKWNLIGSDARYSTKVVFSSVLIYLLNKEELQLCVLSVFGTGNAPWHGVLIIARFKANPALIAKA